MFAVYVITLLCLMAVSHSAPLACEDLVRPLDQLDRRHLEGRWVLVAGSLSDAAHLERFKSRQSASVSFANASETSKMYLRRVFSFGDNCQYVNSNVTLEGSGFTFDQSNLTVTVLRTSCPDCVVMRFDDGSKKLHRVYLFSRRREVEQKEMEEFTAQVECLNILPPVVMDPSKDLCPEEISTEPTAPTEEKTGA